MDRSAYPAWGGRTTDELNERRTAAAWFADDRYLRELAAGASPARARESVLNRLRWIHAAELTAAEAALDLRQGLSRDAA